MSNGTYTPQIILELWNAPYRWWWFPVKWDVARDAPWQLTYVFGNIAILRPEKSGHHSGVRLRARARLPSDSKCQRSPKQAVHTSSERDSAWSQSCVVSDKFVSGRREWTHVVSFSILAVGQLLGWLMQTVLLHWFYSNVNIWSVQARCIFRAHRRSQTWSLPDKVYMLMNKTVDILLSGW